MADDVKQQSEASLEQVRRILFGEQIDSVLERFEKIESSLADEVATLRQELAKRAKKLDDEGADRDAKVNDRVDEVLSRVDSLREESLSARDDLERALRDRIDKAIAQTVTDTEIELDKKVARNDLANALMALANQLTSDAKSMVDQEVGA